MRKIRRIMRRAKHLMTVSAIAALLYAAGCARPSVQNGTTAAQATAQADEPLFIIETTEAPVSLSAMKVISETSQEAQEAPDAQDMTPAVATQAEVLLEPETDPPAAQTTESGQNTPASPIPTFLHAVEKPPFSAGDAAPYSGEPSTVVHGDIPFLEKPDDATPYIILTPYDSLGRCGACIMLAGPETIQYGERGSTGQAKPSGWHQAKYPGIVDSEPPYLMNRAHLLMWALSGLTDTGENLISGTRYFNTEAMLPIELAVVRHVEQAGTHILYRVTPIFEGDNLLASGVLMEAIGLEDDFHLCRYAYNVQPGVYIDYATGQNRLAD